MKWPHSLRALFLIKKKFIRTFFSNIFFRLLIKKDHFARAIARIRIRPFKLIVKSGEKYRYATREESERFLRIVKLHKLIQLHCVQWRVRKLLVLIN